MYSPTNKPPFGAVFNKAHPLAPDLGAFVFNERGGLTAYNWCNSSNHGTIVGASSFSFEGIRFRTSNPGGVSNFRVRLASDPTIGLSTLSIVTLIVPGSGAPSQQALAGAFDNATNMGCSLYVFSNLNFRVNNTSQSFGSTSFSDLVNRPTWIAATYDARAGFDFNRVYINGILEGETTTAGSIGIGTPPAFDLLQLDSSASTSFHGWTYLTYIYSRALASADLRQLMLQPYAMFGNSRKFVFNTAPVIDVARVIFAKA